MGLPGGSLERSLTALTIGLAQSQQARANRLSDGAQGEYEQQLHSDFSGLATRASTFMDTVVAFPFPFLYAPDQRLIPFERPHFTPGFELLGKTAVVVRFDAHVTGWVTSEEGWTTGAEVRFAAIAPEAPDAGVPFSAIAHLTFQGYASYAEGDEFQQ